MNKELSDLCFDYIVEGTGLFESILVCALSKAGKRVLQIESEAFYGGQAEGTVWNKEQLQIIGQFNILNDFQGKFKFDLGVKMLYADCSLSHLMIRTRVAAHLDFKTIDCIQCYCSIKKKFVEFPLTKEQIFLSKHLSLVEKRNTMQFLKQLVQCPKAFSRGELQNLPSTLQEGVGMCIEKEQDAEAFVRSCGKFSASPFLYCMYGSVELIQSFVRLAAVNGAIQMLNAKEMNWHEENGLLLLAQSVESSQEIVEKAFDSKEKIEFGDESNSKNQSLFKNEAPSNKEISQSIHSKPITRQSLFIQRPHFDAEQDFFTRTKKLITKSPFSNNQKKNSFIWRKIAFLSSPILHSSSNNAAKAIKAYKRIQQSAILHIFQCDHTSMLCPEGSFFCAFESLVPFDAEYEQLVQPASIIISQLSFQIPNTHSFTCYGATEEKEIHIECKNEPTFSQYFSMAQEAFYLLEPELEFFPDGSSEQLYSE
jgi:hypothetical protein